MNKKSVLTLLLCGSILGFQGCKPEQGNPGPQGVQGDAGKDGINGTNGPAGVKGTTGDKGVTGDKGAIGTTAKIGRTTDWKPLTFEFVREIVSSTGSKSLFFEATVNDVTLDKNTVDYSLFTYFVKNRELTKVPVQISTNYNTVYTSAGLIAGTYSRGDVAVLSIKEGQAKVVVRYESSAYTSLGAEKLKTALNDEKFQFQINIIPIPKG